MKFIFDINNPHQQYIQITAEIKTTGKETIVFFPAWRPGRYELGDFAKNVNHFRVFDEKGEQLNFQKQNKNSWLVQTEGCETITIKYSYYANELNAGSTFLNADQLYVNPVNCCLFTDNEYNESIEMKLNIPEHWEVAHSLKVKDNTFTADNYDQLADSPFICSAQLQSKTYKIEGTIFYIWFNGLVKPNWEKLINDFEQFTKTQIEKYKKFPVDEYHFLFQILPYKTYHGVEHCKSTVITLGPSYAVFEELYTELLGVSSHELYHTWNVKSIRPKKWMPYDFTKENYSELGYIAEGVTTYMGDLMLYKSGVFSLDQYFLEMNAQIQKHQDNFGRLNYSVAASSFDTWLDGYVKGAPARKVSIYTEGCLLAFMIDVQILKSTNNKKSLDDVMCNLYHNFGAQGKGVSRNAYQKAIEEVAGCSFQTFFDNYIYGTKNYSPLLEQCFDDLGIELLQKPVKDNFSAYLGAKTVLKGGRTCIDSIYPDGAYDKAGGQLDDEIISINGVAVSNNASQWIRFFKEDPIEVLVNRNGRIIKLTSIKIKSSYYQKFYLKLLKNPSQEQIEAFDGWKK